MTSRIIFTLICISLICTIIYLYKNYGLGLKKEFYDYNLFENESVNNNNSPDNISSYMDINELSNNLENNPLISQTNNTLCIKLFDKLGKGIVFSPISITLILSLIHLNSYDKTNNELTSLFGYKYRLGELKSIYKTFNNNIIKMTNTIIINNKYKVNNKQLKSIQKLALIEYNNFNDKQLIVNNVNRYVSNNTNSLIKNVLNGDMISNDTIMILINTIYFKANWLNKFNEENTSKMIFRGRNEMKVDMMYQNSKFKYFETNDLQMIEMPYSDYNYTMGIVLPKNDDIINLNLGQLQYNISCLKNEKVKLYLPKFEHRMKIELVPILRELGVNELFTENAKLGIVENAFVSKIIHEAVVIVDENGTEAAAFTAALLTENCARPNSKDEIIFKADHPFIYYIRHLPSNIILFYGQFDGVV